MVSEIDESEFRRAILIVPKENGLQGSREEQTLIMQDIYPTNDLVKELKQLHLVHKPYVTRQGCGFELQKIAYLDIV
jgi:hypothetical protein